MVEIEFFHRFLVKVPRVEAFFFEAEEDET